MSAGKLGSVFVVPADLETMEIAQPIVKRGRFQPAARQARAVRMAIAAALVWIGASGSAVGLDLGDVVVGKSYKPSNAYRQSKRLPDECRRVALLPVSVTANDRDTETGRSTVDASLAQELTRTRRFEVVTVSPEQLKRWTGKASWEELEPLPQGFLDRVREELGCDAVILGHVTHFRAYAPVAVGLRLKLADCRRGQILWAADEVFDGGEAAVANAARRYLQRHRTDRLTEADSRIILSSPARFSRYCAEALFFTLPTR